MKVTTITGTALGALLIAALASSTALAQDVGRVDWSGPYLGVHVGLMDADVDAKYTGPAVGADTNFEQTLNSLTLVPFAGYNWQRDRYVFGAEIDVGIPHNAEDDARPGGKAGMHLKVNSHIWGRAGYLVQDDFLVYGALGATAARIETHRVPAAITPQDRETSYIYGLSIGAGTEYAVSKNLRFRVNYVYDHYFDRTLTHTEPFGGILFPKTRADIDSHTIRVGLSTSF